MRNASKHQLESLRIIESNHGIAVAIIEFFWIDRAPCEEHVPRLGRVSDSPVNLDSRFGIAIGLPNDSVDLAYREVGHIGLILHRKSWFIEEKDA
jgi:hypothetical protein